MEFKLRTVQCAGPTGLHRMAYTEWGDPRNPRILVCVHALTRNDRVLAIAVGRGLTRLGPRRNAVAGVSRQVLQGRRGYVAL